jgi:hypothetical protein
LQVDDSVLVANDAADVINTELEIIEDEDIEA